MSDETLGTPIDPDDLPIQDGSTLLGFLHILKKAHLELLGASGAQEAIDKYKLVTTRRHAKEYIDELMPQLLAERKRRREKRHGDKGKGKPAPHR